MRQLRGDSNTKWVWVFALLGTMWGTTARAEFDDFRAMWVSRFDYTASSTSSIDAVMANSAAMGITDVLFQVRGRADAFYNGSTYEPKAAAAGGNDPLQDAIDAAHANGLKLHAWVNAMPLWNLANPPSSSTVQPASLHPFYNEPNPTPANPGFRLFDNSGNVEPPDGWSNYAISNPVQPDVHEHINNVVSDISTRYDVDGIHLDYIRYLANSFDRLPHDDLSHQMFFNETGLDGSDSDNEVPYRNFVMGRITDLVGSIKDTVDMAELATSREIDLSAAVWRDPDVAKNDYLQDYRTWLESDLLDIAMPMMYLHSGTDHLFNPNLANTMSIQTNTRIAPGLGVYLHDENSGGVELTIEQLGRLYNAGTDGATFYHYPSFYGDSLSAQRRAAVTDFYESLIDPEDLEPTILADFESGEEPFGWDFDTSPPSQTFGLAETTTIDQVTTHAREGAASQALQLDSDGSDQWQLRHNSGIGSSASPEANVPFASTGYVGFWLKTESPGVEVQIALDDPETADRGVLADVIADGQWHLYEWDLDDAGQWEGWVNGDGAITGTTVTLDSVFFYGSSDAQVYMDFAAHNPHGSLLELVAALPGDYDGNGMIDTADYMAWRDSFGQEVDAGTGADGNGDGIINSADYVIWRNLFAAQASGELHDAAAVPEPATRMALLLAMLAAPLLRVGYIR